VSVPETDVASTRSETNVISGFRSVSRNFADRTSPSRWSLPVLKLAASISTRRRDSDSGSATSTVPPRIANVPCTGMRPKRCLLLNEMDELFVSIV
jgi:hypothetical protein